MPVRYHFGDDGKLGWADPALDDSSWTVAQNGTIPSRAREINRFVWIRMRLRVPSRPGGPWALHLDELGIQPMAWQVFANGQLLGGQGDFPPHADPVEPPVSPVISLPASLAQPGHVVALREWHAPVFIEGGAASHPVAVINEAGALRLTVRARAAEGFGSRGAGVCAERDAGAGWHRSAAVLALNRRA
jgi:hypothetical protein